MSLLIRSSSLVRQIFCRNSISRKPRPSVVNELKVSNSLHTRVVYKQCILGKKFNDFNIRHFQQVAPVVAEQNIRKRQPFRSQNISNANDLDKAMFKLDVDVRRVGRLNKVDVESILREIKSLGKATSMQGLLIIRCCGSLLAEENISSRTELSSRLWKMLEDIACPLDVSHYNALLKVYLDNEQPFSPIEFLAKMDQNEIVPNRVTYQRLIAGYCQKGDLDGAGKILEFMKEKEIAVNEFVFNELIYGHAKANDTKGARDMLEVMKNSKLDPSSDSYFQLAKGFALHGNIEEINKTIDEAERNDVFLVDRDFLNIVSTLAVNGHANKVDDILKRTKKNTGYNQECINVCLELINRGQDETAYKILMTMPRSVMKDGSLVAAGNFLIKQMVRVGRPAELVVRYCKELQELKLNDEGLLKATESALIFKKPDHALLFLNEMANKGYQIRNHYFWPVLIQKAVEGEQGVYNVLKIMCDLPCIPNYDTYIDYALPNLNTSDPRVVVSKLKDFGQITGIIVNPLMAFYLNQNETTKAASLLDEYPVTLDPTLLIRSLALSFRGLKDVEPIIKILIHMKDNLRSSPERASAVDCCGQFLWEYSISRYYEKKNLNVLLKVMKEKDLQFPFIMNKLTSEVISTLEKLDYSKTNISLNESYSPQNTSQMNDMNVEELENHLLELRSKKLNVRGVLRRLLMVHCRFHNVDRALEIKEQLDKDNFHYTPSMHSLLMDIFVHSGKLAEALEMKNLIEQGDPNFQIDSFKILNLAALMVKEGNVDEAIDVINNYYGKFGPSKKDDGFQDRNVFKLLSSAADKGDIELTNKLFDLVVVRCEYSKPTNVILGCKIKACLNSNDIPAALKEFEFCATNYKCTPWRNELFKHLIISEDTENLQKLVDLSNNVHGETNILYSLACSFIELDRIKQAKKILETPGLRAYNNRLEQMCENFVEGGKIKELEHFVLITKDLFEIDRDRMYYNLLKGYAKQNDVKKALGVWTSMQEEDIQPSLKTLRFLAEYLKKNNEPVPFEVPLSDKSNRPINQDSKIKHCIMQGKHTEALQLTEALLHQGLVPNLKLLKQIVVYLSDKGDVESLQKICSYLSEEYRIKLKVNNILCVAYINSGQQETLIDRMENENNFRNSLYGGYLVILNRCPELESRIVEIAERCHKEDNFMVPKNMVWQYYFINGDYDKADEIMKSCPEMRGNLMLRSVLKKIIKEKSVTLAKKLISVVCNNESTPSNKGLVYSSLIESLVKTNQINAALETFNEAKEKHTISVHDFFASTLVNLSEALQNEGQTVPFELLNLKQRRQQRSSSSSSSDSSDDDKPK